jgi:DNA polymerase III subunit epsilon
MTYKEFIVLDIETTGVDPDTGDIIEVAAVKLDATGQRIGELNVLVGTDQQINTFVRALTGIQQADVEGKPKIADLLPQIVEFIGDAPIVGHNISFDVDFLNGKGANLKNPLLDTLDLSQTILPKQTGYSLEYLGYRFNFPNKSSHRAFDDVLATVDLFYLLIGQVQALSATTKTQITELLAGNDWSWLWLFNESETFSVPKFQSNGTHIEDFLAKQVSLANATYLSQIVTATNDKKAFIESNFAVDNLALALAYANEHKPAILCLPFHDFKSPDWTKLSEKLNLKIMPVESAELNYRDNAETDVIANLPVVSTTEARLIAKTIIWKNDWNKDYSKLYLTSEEKYQWEQKFIDEDKKTFDIIAEQKPDIIVATPQSLLNFGSAGGYSLVITDPLGLEDSAFRNAGRVFSVPYFNALIASRRDFVHMNIRENNFKLADNLFKLLNDAGSSLAELTQKLIDIFAAHPPLNPFDRNLELSIGHFDEETRALFASTIKSLEEYLSLVKDAKLEDNERQIDHTEKLLAHFKALSSQDSAFRYFLWADGHRFFLELVPTVPDFSNLNEVLDSAKQVRVLGSGLSYAGGFHYWQTAFPNFASVAIAGDLRGEIPVVGDLPDDDNYLHAFANLAETVAAKRTNTLVLGGSGFDSNQTFENLYDRLRVDGVETDSSDTVRAVENLPGLYATEGRVCIVGHYNWFERARFFIEPVETILLGKVPFEASSRPQSKVMQGDFNGFETYTLPRTVMRFKEVLHDLLLSQKPLILADSRLFRRDYGHKIMNSCKGAAFTPQTSREILEG